MIRKIFITIIALVLVVSACAVPAFASSLDTVVLPDLGGFTDDMQGVTLKYAKGLKLMFGNVLDLLNGKKTVSEYISDCYELADEYGLGFVSDTLNVVDENTISARELANIMINIMRKEIVNNGGNVSNFPTSDTRLMLPNGGYIIPSYELYLNGPYEVYRMHYYVYNPSGVCVYDATSNRYLASTSFVPPFFDFEFISSTASSVEYYCSYYKYYNQQLDRGSYSFYIPFAFDSDGDFGLSNESPDVDDLSDDDLIK